MGSTSESVDHEFETLMRTHAHNISYALRQVLRSRHANLIPDAEQEIYLAIWKQLEKGNKIDHPSSYIYRVALRVGLNLKKKAAEEIEMSAETLEAIQDHTPSEPGFHRVDLLKKALAGLPRDSEKAIRAYLMGYDFREVATLFSWTDSVARHRIYRGIKKLKSLIWELNDEKSH